MEAEEEAEIKVVPVDFFVREVQSIEPLGKELESPRKMVWEFEDLAIAFS